MPSDDFVPADDDQIAEDEAIRTEALRTSGFHELQCGCVVWSKKTKRNGVGYLVRMCPNARRLFDKYGVSYTVNIWSRRTTSNNMSWTITMHDHLREGVMV